MSDATTHSANHGASGHSADGSHGETRRDFLYIAAGAATAGGAAAVALPFIHQMNPAADTLALASIEVDLASVSEGQQISVMWRGKPLFVRHRTAKDIADAKAADGANFRDKQTDAERVMQSDGKAGKEEFLIMSANCTHLGCIPKADGEPGFEGAYGGGWYCPCHGSHYDSAGRIRQGPAPLNLPVPPYVYVSDTVVKIG